jgi:beta-glucosidase
LNAVRFWKEDEMMKKTVWMLAASVAFACRAGVELPLSDDVAFRKAEAIRAKMTLEQKVSLLGGCATMYLKSYPELGIPREWAMSDCSHAVKPEHDRAEWPYVPGVDRRSVVMPPLSAVAQTWNPSLAARHGKAVAEQMRALGKDQLLGPGVNIMRTPLCGRNWEYMSEDPFLASRLVVPYIRAAQKEGVAATVKHFCVNNQEMARLTLDTIVDERTLHEIYLPAFRAAVQDAGAIALMTAYNKYNGQYVSENAYLQRGILRDRWGFKGLIVTDWGGQHSTVPAALNGGNVEMDKGAGIRYFTDYYGTGRFPLLDAVRANQVPEATVDEMVTRVLFAMAKTGFLDGLQPAGARFTDEQHRTQIEIGEEAIVLLKNDAKVLPLARANVRKVAVVGFRSDMNYTHLGSSCEGMAEKETTAFQAIKAYLGPGVDVALFPLGAEATDAEALAPIPGAQLETFREKSTDAFVQRAWKFYSWDGEGAWDVSRAKEAGFVDYPAGRKVAAQRFVATVRVPETASYRFLLADGAKCNWSSVRIDGREVFSTTNGVARAVTLEKDARVEVTVDVAGCRRENGFVFGWRKTVPDTRTLDEKERFLKEADATIVFTGSLVGHGRARESEGADLPNMKGPYGHDEEIDRLLSAGLKNLVVVHRSSTPLEMPWADRCATLLQVPFLGQDSAALPRVIFGDVNPSGKLACSFPRSYEDTAVAKMGTYNDKQVIYKERFYVGYRWHDKSGIAPLFPFGHGLSYTTFRFSRAKVEPRADGGWTVSVDVTNAGPVPGKEVVQLYMMPLDPTVERCAKELKGFAKTKTLKPGRTQRVSIDVSPRDLAYYDTFLHRWVAEKGRYCFALGTTSACLPVRVQVSQEERTVFEDR